MKFETEFRIKEKEFRPRKDFSHKKVVDELANVVKEADNHIEDLEDHLDNSIDIICERDGTIRSLIGVAVVSTLINFIGALFIYVL